MALLTIAAITTPAALAPFLALEGVARAEVPPEILLDHPTARFWLACLADEPAGLAVTVVVPKLDARRGFLFVDELVVLPTFRRRGVARALLTYLEHQAQALGLAGVRLLARPENLAAQALYAACGYQASPTVLWAKTSPH